MKEEFITKDYFDATFERFDKKFEQFSNLVTESFAYLNVKIDDVEKRLSARIGGVEHRLDRIESRLDQVESRLDRVESRLDRVESRLDVTNARLNDLSEHFGKMEETRVSRVEHKLLKSRVQALENTHAPA